MKRGEIDAELDHHLRRVRAHPREDRLRAEQSHGLRHLDEDVCDGGVHHLDAGDIEDHDARRLFDDPVEDRAHDLFGPLGIDIADEG